MKGQEIASAYQIDLDQFVDFLTQSGRPYKRTYWDGELIIPDDQVEEDVKAFRDYQRQREEAEAERVVKKAEQEAAERKQSEKAAEAYRKADEVRTEAVRLEDELAKRTKRYKVVAGPLIIDVKYGETDKAFREFESIINRETVNGWEFHSIERLTVSEEQEGCFGGSSSSKKNTVYYMLIFVRNV